MIINAIAIANGGTTRPPVLEQLNATENGTYTPSTGVDGFNPVNVDVQPNLQTKSVEITSNGQSTVVADSSFDGLDSVNLNINVPIPTFQTEELTATRNGTFTPSTDGYSKVSVNVQPKLQTKSVEITENGQSTVVADSSFDGLDSVNLNINVPIPTFQTEELSVASNGTYTPSTDGYSKVTVNVQPKLQAKSTTTTITANGTSTISVTPDSNYDGLSSASVTITTNVEASGGSSAPTIYITNGTKLCLPNNNGEVSDLSGISTIGLTTMANMFENSTTTGILIDGWNVSGVTSIANLLNNCGSVTSLAMKNMNFSDTLTTDNAFDGASSIQTLDFSGSNATFLNTIQTSIMPMALTFRGSTFNSYPSFEYFSAMNSEVDISDCDMSNITSDPNGFGMFITDFSNIIVNENTVLPNCDIDMRLNMSWMDSEENVIKFFDCLIPNAGHTVTYLYKMGGNIKSEWATDNVLAFIQSKGWSVAGKSESE